MARRKRKDPNKEHKPKVNWLKLFELALRLLLAMIDIRWIALLIVLIALPIAPYVLIPRADASASVCTYFGSRGLWQPGWATDCPAIALRPQHQMDW